MADRTRAAKDGKGAGALRSAVLARSVGHVDLFCDYDGVLASIAARPQDARMGAGVARSLARLARRRSFHVSVVSGRALADARARVGVRGITYAGNHGLDIAGPGMRRVHTIPQRTLAALRELATELESAMRPHPGVIVEDKQLAVAVHFCLARRRKRRIIARFSEIVALHNAGGLMRVTSGKDLIEARPAVAWDKGRAVRWLVRRRHGADWRRRVLPVYLGDDETDEDAFRALRGKGITVRVGGGPSGTAARYALRDQREVHAFLVWLGHTFQ